MPRAAETINLRGRGSAYILMAKTVKPAPSVWNPDIETLSRPQLHQLQISRLNELLVYLRVNSPFYKRKLNAQSSINSLADLKTFPFCNKADLQNSYPTGL